MLPPPRSQQLLSVDSREIIKAKIPLTIHQSLRSFTGLMLVPEGAIRAGPRSARVKPRSLMPNCDYYPPASSQCSAQHLIDITSPLHSGSSMLTHCPPPYKHTHIRMPNSFQVWVMTPQTSRNSSVFTVPLWLWVIFLEF